jgi:hypothetical protein
MSVTQHLKSDQGIDRKKAQGWTAPSMPVVLRIPRIAEDQPILSEIAPRRPEFRWRVGVGAAMLMLVAALPWLIRWHPPVENAPEVFASAIAMPEDSEIELLPPLYAKATSGSAPSLENESGAAEILDCLVVPPPSGGSQ